MSKKSTPVATQNETAPEQEIPVVPEEKTDDLGQAVSVHNEVVTEDLVPGSKLVAYYLGEGYAFLPFKTRFKDQAVEKANEIRKAGDLSAYVVLKKGWYGVFTKKAEAREEKAKKVEAAKRVVPVEIDGQRFESTRAAREFARKILDACRAAEDEA